MHLWFSENPQYEGHLHSEEGEEEPEGSGSSAYDILNSGATIILMGYVIQDLGTVDTELSKTTFKQLGSKYILNNVSLAKLRQIEKLNF